MLNLDELNLESGSHTEREKGVCLMEVRRRANGTLGPVDSVNSLMSRLVRNGDCLEFTGCRNADGYGTLRVRGKMTKAHRFSWELVYGRVPKGLLVCHRCDNPPCCNVEHLFLGTVADNNRDRHSKGRTQNLESGRAARHAALRAITHCPAGHQYSGDNVRYRANGARRCAECCRIASRRRRGSK